MAGAYRKCAKCGADIAESAEWVRHCPKCAGVPDDSQATFLSDQGYYLELGKPAKDRTLKHCLGGPHEVPGAICNGHGCNRPFIRLLTLDVRDPKLSFIQPLKRRAAGGLAAHQLPLFYCWPCGGWPTYRLEPTGHIAVIGRSSTGPEKDFPYPGYPKSFPERRARLTPIPAEVQRLIREANAGTLDSDLKFDPKVARHLKPHHQVGGVPYFVQGDHEANNCPECGAIMPVLASASADSGSEKSFVSDPFTQVIFDYCARCQIVRASHQSD